MSRHGLLTSVLVGLVLLGGCAGRSTQPDTAPTERQSRDRSARLAFDQGNYEQAATLYRSALESALTEDAPRAIIDARFNLALCEAYRGRYDEALAQVDQADAERVRRGLDADPDLQLLAGTIHYRAGQIDRAESGLNALLAGTAVPRPTAAKAHFVAGLIAADRTAVDALRGHIAALGRDVGGAADVDRMELQGRLVAIEGDAAGALALLDQVVLMRRLERDYRGMVRVLASEGGIAEAAGKLQLAGNYFLRAGRSAAQRAEPEAVAWLGRASALGERSGDQALVREAQAILAGLNKPG